MLLSICLYTTAVLSFYTLAYIYLGHLLFIPKVFHFNLFLFVLIFSDEDTRSDLKKLPAFPTAVLKEHPSLAFW